MVWSAPGQIFNVGVCICVLNIFGIVLIPSFPLRFIPDGIKPLLNGKDYQIIAPSWLTANSRFTVSHRGLAIGGQVSDVLGVIGQAIPQRAPIRQREVCMLVRPRAGVKYALSLDELASIWGMHNRGILFKGGSNPPECMGSFHNERVQRTLQVASAAGRKYSVGKTMDHRHLHYVLTYVLLPRKGNHGTLSEEDLIILWAMVKEHELNWPYLIAYHLMSYTIGQTKVLKHFNIDLSGEDAVPVSDENAITLRHLNQMRRNVNATVGGNNEGKAAGEDIPHQPGVGSSYQFPPELMESFSQGVQSFRSAWGENFQNMGRRLDGFEAQLTNQEDEVRGLGNDIRGWFDQFLRSNDQGFNDSAPGQD
ncbi:hypothetical protein PIB30_072296 [Stylosanthes scabra]|uniref:Uncharacterized protein n=1 Tax=Stylosanthes scabra TaxID=79078 RepID=A0ABU6URT5_9FABA|nr:hypothetical protein [Stylosanthes scabra]